MMRIEKFYVLSQSKRKHVFRSNFPGMLGGRLPDGVAKLPTLPIHIFPGNNIKIVFNYNISKMIL